MSKRVLIQGFWEVITQRDKTQVHQKSDQLIEKKKHASLSDWTWSKRFWQEIHGFGTTTSGKTTTASTTESLTCWKRCSTLEFEFPRIHLFILRRRFMFFYRKPGKRSSRMKTKGIIRSRPASDNFSWTLIVPDSISAELLNPGSWTRWWKTAVRQNGLSRGKFESNAVLLIWTQNGSNLYCSKKIKKSNYR